MNARFSSPRRYVWPPHCVESTTLAVQPPALPLSLRTRRPFQRLPGVSDALKNFRQTAQVFVAQVVVVVLYSIFRTRLNRGLGKHSQDFQVPRQVDAVY